MADQDFYGVFITLDGDTLLLPNLAVAEVVGHQELDRPDDAPPWWQGVLRWSGHSIPVVSFEVLNGALSSPTPERRTRIAVVNSTGSSVSSGHLAFLCRGYPHLITLNRDAVRSVALRDTDEEEMVLARVGVANTQAVVPDLDAIEERVVQTQRAIDAIA